MVQTGQETKRYVCSYHNRNVRAYVDDKIIASFFENGKEKVITGIITNVGSKYLILRISPIVNFNPNVDGRNSEWKIKKIIINDMVKFVKYPKGSQDFGNYYLGGKDTRRKKWMDNYL